METKKLPWIQRFNSYTNALACLSRFIKKGNLNEFEEQGLIHLFECVHELAWKTLKDFFEHRGNQNLYGPKDATKNAIKEGLMVDEDGKIWMDMIQSRRMIPKAYHKTIAVEISAAIVGDYYPAFVALRERLKKLAEEETQYESDGATPIKQCQ